MIDYPSPIAYNVNIRTTKGDNNNELWWKSQSTNDEVYAVQKRIPPAYLPLGTKDLWKDYAADYGMSVTELITKLIEKDMKEHNWSGGIGFKLK